LDTFVWEPRASLPYDIEFNQALPYRESFMLVGGQSDQVDAFALDTIYYYDPEEDEWELLEAKLEEGKHNFPLFYIPDEYANCG